MNPTTSLFIKISILISLSVQVLATSHFSSSSLEGELEAINSSTPKLRRRQAADAQAVNPAGATQPANNGPGGRNEPLSKEEELASKMFELIIDMGLGLESVTSLGSSEKEITNDSKKVEGIVPKLKTVTQNLLATVPTKTEDLNKVVESSEQAGDAIVKSLLEIEKKPEDANLIKSHFKSLEAAFQKILSASDGVAVAAIPKLAELIKNDDKKQGGGQGPNGKNDANKPEDQNNSSVQVLNADAAKPAEGNPAEHKPAEQKPEEKAPEQNAGANVEPKAIEPIVPDNVVIPGQ